MEALYSYCKRQCGACWEFAPPLGSGRADTCSYYGKPAGAFHRVESGDGEHHVCGSMLR